MRGLTKTVRRFSAMIPVPKRVAWNAHTGDLYVRCDDEKGRIWEEHMSGIDRMRVQGLPEHLIELSYWGNLGNNQTRGYYRTSADAVVDMSVEQCNCLLSSIQSLRKQACSMLGITTEEER